MMPHTHPHAVTSTIEPPDTAALLVIALHPPATPAGAPNRHVPATSATTNGAPPTVATVATTSSTGTDPDSDLGRRTRLALATTLRDLHRYTIDTMHVTLADPIPPGGQTACSRRLGFLTKRVKVMQVLQDRIRGASWAALAIQLRRDEDTIRAIYAPMEQAWRAGSLTPWAPDVPGVEVLTGLMPLDLSNATEDDLMPYLWMHRSPQSAPPRN